MKHLSEMRFQELLDPKGYSCPSCGRHHTTGLKLFEAGRGAIKRLPEMLTKLGIQKPFIVCDKNTYEAAGEQVEALLKDAGIPYKLFTLTAEHVEPDEFSVGSILLSYDPASDGVISVGSGVINDCCKVVAHAVGRAAGGGGHSAVDGRLRVRLVLDARQRRQINRLQRLPGWDHLR